MIRQLNWIPIDNLIKMRKILLVFNTLHTSTPVEVRNLSFSCESHEAITRSSLTDLKLQSIKSELSKSKLSYSGAKLFNSLPTELKIIDSFTTSSFKANIKHFFIKMNYEVNHLEHFACLSCKYLVVCNCF